MGLGGGWGLAGAELEGLALAGVPRLGQAGLGEHVTLIYVMPGPVADLRLDSTCPPSNQPPQPPPPCAPHGLSARQMLEEAEERKEG